MRGVKYNTEEERKEALRLANVRYNNKHPERRRQTKLNWRTSAFYVYTHTNSKGDMYIGCGQKCRPNNFTHRTTYWFDAFKEDCNVNIIAEFKDKESARELERVMIEEAGLHNLVNRIR
tara:strand:+ start:542 stop:898 length:357 start_codon:yes stop_codon:yes gene_type:complete